MLSAIGLIPFLVIGILIWFFLRSNKRPKRRMNRKSTYVFLAAYVAILLSATLTVELVDTKFKAGQPKAGSSEEVDFLENAVQNGDIKSIDSSKIIDKRTHAVGKTLSITSRDNDNTTIIVERKSGNDGLIEETIVKPLFLMGDFDFSDQVNYTKPIWEGNKVVFPTPPLTEITYTSYNDAYLLRQFTRIPRQDNFSHHSQSRQIAVHLLVPKNLIITADDHLYINYINE